MGQNTVFVGKMYDALAPFWQVYYQDWYREELNHRHVEQEKGKAEH